MPNNDFKAFALAPGANVLSQNDYAQLAALSTGWQSGVAKSSEVNKAIRQATTIAALVGQFIANSGSDALDNADVNGLVANFTKAVSGRYSNAISFGVSGTYTWPADVKFIEVIVTGAGGGGGGCNASTASDTYFGAGGGGGGTAIGLIRATDPGAGPGSYPVTVGLGGTGGSGAAPGSAGGDSSFLSLTGNGGKGAKRDAPDNTGGGPGGLAFGGYQRVAGAFGQDGQSTTRSISGCGGASFWGGGGISSNLNAPIARGSVGDGGGGAYDMLFRGQSGSGANGGNGVVVIKEYR